MLHYEKKHKNKEVPSLHWYCLYCNFGLWVTNKLFFCLINIACPWNRIFWNILENSRKTFYIYTRIHTYIRSYIHIHTHGYERWFSLYRHQTILEIQRYSPLNRVTLSNGRASRCVKGSAPQWWGWTTSSYVVHRFLQLSNFSRISVEYTANESIASREYNSCFVLAASFYTRVKRVK